MQFGAFNLQDDRVRTVETDVYSPPKNDVQSDRLAGGDGAVIVKRSFDQKIFSIRGTLKADTREDLERLINEFNTAIFQPNQAFDIDYAGMVRRFVATAQNVIITTRGFTTAGFSVEFVCPSGVGSDTFNTVMLNATAVTTATASLAVNVGGTYKAEPTIRMTVNAVTGGATKRVAITNGSTQRGVSIVRTWAVGDVLEIDSLNKTIYVNNAPVDYIGQFPVWPAGAGVIGYVDEFTTREVTLNGFYVRRYL
ncbi:phage distal tail protein [Rhodococcus sp. IEGM 1374]|uniref:phage distal tail protein n=1 Tax=Rhodococcus sp. IEGM 1374 TaxID=3082221 RepID=UPI0029552FF1|nr:phage tail domain-containing protein [Rhodococcus sp. IEGM 1374]MDV7992056.1 phage tail family protein [Rhodococcus sp. IEGM 1374]